MGDLQGWPNVVDVNPVFRVVRKIEDKHGIVIYRENRRTVRPPRRLEGFRVLREGRVVVGQIRNVPIIVNGGPPETISEEQRVLGSYLPL